VAKEVDKQQETENGSYTNGTQTSRLVILTAPPINPDALISDDGVRIASIPK
jgi:hypothetical protein